MNIFVLNYDLEISAQELCDQHLRKQILEIAQLLCTARYLQGDLDVPYNPTHKSHPVTKWLLESRDNFQFCLMYNWLYLGKEYEYRFGKKHKSATVLIRLYDEFQPSVTITKFPIRNDKEYYKEKLQSWVKREKPLIPKWTRRPQPTWIKI